MKTFGIVLTAILGTVLGLDNGRALIPPRGWNSWYAALMNPSEDLVRSTAAAMKANGFFDAGYRTLNLDDGMVEVERDANGNLVPDKTGFPNGFTKLVSDLHAEGFEFGVYTDRGPKTCGGRAGALGHDDQDAKTYASWGVDYVKEDSCGASQDPAQAYYEYSLMRDALASSGRNVTFSLCGWNPWYSPVGSSLGNLWRIGPDDTTWTNVLKNIDINADLASYAGPGGWNDPCLLLGSDINGQQRITEQQSRAQFSMWTVMASPLLLSQDVRNLSAFLTQTYLNEEVLAVHGDPAGRQGQRIAGGPLSAGSGGDTSIVSAPCDASDPNQEWQLDSPSAGFVTHTASKKCLNLNDCDVDLILFDCVTSGGTCCGATCYKNEQWNFTSSSLVSALNTRCVTSSLNSPAYTSTCAALPTQQWSFVSSRIRSPSNLCLQPQTAPSTTNVWSRPLSDGSHALVFLNADPTEVKNVSCPYSGCLDALGWPSFLNATVRDLWQHKDLPVLNINDGLQANNLQPNGGVAMYRIHPIYTNQTTL